MLDTLLSHIAPHLCYSCGKIGAVLCDNCKYYIVDDNLTMCIVCGGETGVGGVCLSHATHFTRAWHIGERTSDLRRLVDDYKFQNVREAYNPLASLLSERIGSLPPSVALVPIPTLSSHIRKRGYDQTHLLAKKLAQLQGAALFPALKRVSRTVQRGASRIQRLEQAKVAFQATAQLNGGTYLLIDDIVTTGATLNFAAKTLLDAGANDVWVAAVARQPIDTAKNN